MDLDETLIHSCNLKENPQHILTAINEFGEKISVNYLFFLKQQVFLAGDQYPTFLHRIPQNNDRILRHIRFYSFQPELRQYHHQLHRSHWEVHQWYTHPVQLHGN